VIAPRILIVDDDVDCATSFADFLALHGHGVKLAFSGEEAISKYREHRFDLTFWTRSFPASAASKSARKSTRSTRMPQ
jgi:DNA-binding response OmpR family regulator